LDVDLPCAANAGTKFLLLGQATARHDYLTAPSYEYLSRLFGFSPPNLILESSYAER
jgi:hypothetical protein